MIHIYRSIMGWRHKAALAFILVAASAAYGNYQAIDVSNKLKSAVESNCVIIEQLKEATRTNAIAQNEIRQTIEPFSESEKRRFQTDTNTAVSRFDKRDCTKVPPKS